MFSLFKETQKQHAERTEIANRPSLQPRPTLAAMVMARVAVRAEAEAHLKEYDELAGSVGVMPPDLAIEKFKAFLASNDLPIFSLPEVIKYMDAKATAEGKDGWQWRPLREKDCMFMIDARFGTSGQKYWNGSRWSFQSRASDYYEGKRWEQSREDGRKRELSQASSTPYDRTIPLHALRRVALIERGHKGRIAFFVSDYALADIIQAPDPFLMAVVPNPSLDKGVGRFVIDFWDEPGFGIEQMLK